jgi:hypothetical protein
VEHRGCSPINPSANALCVKLESTHEISQLSNHQLDLVHFHLILSLFPRNFQPYSFEQCFCQGGRCNGALGGPMAATFISTVFLGIAGLMITSILAL